MTDELYEAVFEAAADDDSLSAGAQELLLGALIQEIPAQRTASDEVAPKRVSYLRSILVEGFRGIGPASTLTLPARPGLVVVAGRNGSGKSSFAEALEVVLTQGSHRWSERNRIFSESWRNLHRDNPTRVVVEFEAETGPTKALASWPAGVGFDQLVVHTQRVGEKQVAGLDELGWGAKIDLHRPFLTYDELGALLEPNQLFDALSKVLGLERLTDAEKLLSARVSSLKKPKDEAAKLKRELRGCLTGHPDPRAAQLDALLSKQKPDLQAIGGFVTNVTDDPIDQGLRRVAELEAPDPDTLSAATERVCSAKEAVAETNQAVDRAASAALELLQAALDYYHEHGDGPCPVCGTGVLDTDWQASSRIALLNRSQAQKTSEAARRELAAAQQQVEQVIPAELRRVFASQHDLPSSATARAALTAWEAASAGPSTLSDDLALDVCDQVRNLIAEAKELLAQRDDAWQPIALDLATWLKVAKEAIDNADRLAAAQAAQVWLKKHHHALRDKRLEPIADRARQIWAQLRQESNVDLGAIALKGSVKAQRSVAFNATVDGKEVGALGVMSQGELHALALSVFLPRATRSDSPFGFLVIDDPVQAMDPAKVDGLARVLEETARDRQVVVFTHDDRLPESVRRLRIDATILQVNREINSKVVVSDASDPASRSLDDARAIASDPTLAGTETERRAVQLLCREALEYACRDVYFRVGVRKGLNRNSLEEVWSENVMTNARVKLALHQDPKANIESWLGKGSHRQALGVCTSGLHKNVYEPMAAINAVTKTIADLRSNG